MYDSDRNTLSLLGMTVIDKHSLFKIWQ